MRTYTIKNYIHFKDIVTGEDLTKLNAISFQQISTIQGRDGKKIKGTLTVPDNGLRAMSPGQEYDPTRYPAINLPNMLIKVENYGGGVSLAMPLTDDIFKATALKLKSEGVYAIIVHGNGGAISTLNLRQLYKLKQYYPELAVYCFVDFAAKKVDRIM